MPDSLYNICFLLSELIQVMILGSIVIMLFNKKASITRLFVFALTISIILSIPTYLNLQYLLEIRIILYFIIMALNFKFILSTDYFTAIFGTLFIFVLSAVIEYICMAIIKLSFPPDVEIIILEMYNLARLMIKNIATIILLIVLGIVYYTKMSIKTTEDINVKKMLGVLLNIAIIIILTIPNLLYFFRMFSQISLYILVFNIVMIIVLIVLSVYNAKKFTELSIQKQTIEYQKQYINSLTDAIDGLRGFKHDFNNIINVISGYITLDDFKGLKKYFKQLQNNYRTINNVFPLNTYVKDDPAIYGLLLSKISTAEVKDISFNINVNARLKSNQIKAMDFYKIIGILLDNAFEAAEETEDKYVEIFTKNLDNEGILIEISNSTNNKDVDIEKIYQKGYSTKTEHTGIGLWEVKKIVFKSKNCEINTFTNDNIFTQQLKIY
jgi:two-component system sensor histidine kinase AgrC